MQMTEEENDQGIKSNDVDLIAMGYSGIIISVSLFI